ncbi:MAG: glycosyltransferase family 2 protein, partial [Chloroflexota bacterium]|nr:glycosyltransferase family 2 protein [Chloroflexota bacterium]
MRVSVLVPTLDEELNLPACLESVAWADEVFIVDSFSHDRTIDIARAKGAHVVQHAFESYSRQKNWALESLPFRNDWVLIIDADERVTSAVRAEIESLSPGAGCDGYYLNRRFVFLGAWIRHSGWYPSWNLRLFRHRLGRYDDREVHEHVVLQGQAGYLRNDLLHLDQRGLEAFVARHNRYSTLEASARFKAERDAPDRAALPVSLLVSPIHRKRFLRELVWPWVPGKPLA